MVEQTPALDVYARVSQLGDERQRSTEGQVDDCTARIADLGGHIAEVHIDSGRSAWNPRVHRPGWDRLMARLESGATGGVVVFDLARFSRRPIEGERLIAAAERGLLVLDSEDSYDLTTANGKKHFRDQLTGAAYESDRLSTRVKRGKKLKARRGEPNVSSRPFGFEDRGLELDEKGKAVPGRYDKVREDEAAVIRELAERLLAGESQDDMIVDLNRRGITTSYGKPWTRAGLRQVLTRPRNTGFITYNGAVVSRLPGDPILDETTHERICAVYTARRRGRPASDAYLCSGTVCCGLCGKKLSGRPRANMKPYPDGGVRRQYWCQPRSHDGGCGRIAIDQRDLDRHVGALVVAILADPRHAAAVESAARSAVEQRQKVEAEISECEHLADVLAARLGRREISLTRYDAATGPLDRRLTELRHKLTEIDTAPNEVVSAEVVAASRAEWETRWKVATVTEQRNLLRQALRGRRLVVMPADPKAPRRFDPARIVIEETS